MTLSRLWLLLALAWRNLWRNPRRTLITMLVVCLGVWSILALAIIMDAWAQSSRDTTLRLVAGEGQIHAEGYLDNPTIARRMTPPDAALTAALNADDVAAYASRIRVNAVVQSERRTLPVALFGVDPDAERKLSDIPDHIAQGRYLNGPDDIGVVIGRNLAKRLKTDIGKRVVVMAQDTDGHLAERAYKIVGLFAATQDAEDAYAFTGIKTAALMTGAGDDISEIAFDARDDAALDGLIAKLKSAAPGLDVQSWATLEPFAYAMSGFFDEFLGMWLAIMFALIAIGVVNTQLMAVMERTREFGLLQALGMRPRLVLVDVAMETAMLIAFGVLLGAGLACVSAAAFPNGLDLGFLGGGAEMFGAGRVLYLSVDPAQTARICALVWAMGVAAALWPAWRASRILPVEAMSRALT